MFVARISIIFITIIIIVIIIFLAHWHKAASLKLNWARYDCNGIESELLLLLLLLLSCTQLCVFPILFIVVPASVEQLSSWTLLPSETEGRR